MEINGTMQLAIVSTILPACVTYFGGECSYVIELQKLSSAIYHIFFLSLLLLKVALLSLPDCRLSSTVPGDRTRCTI
jgi:hypothetical protein